MPIGNGAFALYTAKPKRGHFAASHSQSGLVRGMGLLQATAANMLNMIGIGPFMTIPLILDKMGGAQAMLGWLLGLVLTSRAGCGHLPGALGKDSRLATRR